MKNNFNGILKDVENYYSGKLQQFGPVAKGVDWSGEDSQEIRFAQLLRICDKKAKFTINDYGCGYGALFDYMISHGYRFKYFGSDLSKEMISAARKQYKKFKNCRFYVGNGNFKPADYTVASGIFNVKLKQTYPVWKEHVLATINKMDRFSKRGFAFNILTKYSDKEFMRDHLYYADPAFYFDYCKKNFSKAVALLHDYGLYEFTMLVRKQ